jgi:hypothetical protein
VPDPARRTAGAARRTDGPDGKIKIALNETCDYRRSDAGRKKLTALVLGNERERALRQAAAAAAIQATAAEVSSSGGERAGRIAMVISGVFREPMPGSPGPPWPAASACPER